MTGSGVGIGLAVWQTRKDTAATLALHADTSQKISEVEEKVADLDQEVGNLTKLFIDLKENQSKIIQLLERQFRDQLDTRTTQDKTGK